MLSESKLSKQSYFVVKGRLRCYHSSDGEERTTDFHTEAESLTYWLSRKDLLSIEAITWKYSALPESFTRINQKWKNYFLPEPG